MKIPFVDLRTQYDSIRDDVNEQIRNVIDNTSFILGPDVREFEKGFASFCSTRECIGVASGSDALYLSLLALGIGPGDEVITVPNTFISTVDAITRVGAKPVFVDIDRRTYNMDTSLLEEAISERTRAMLPVHLYGQPADMDPVNEIAENHGLKVIEDACQAHGSEYKGKRAGSLGDIGCFSFYPGKNLGAYGDGGAIVTNDPEMAEKLRMMRDYGQKAKSNHEFVGCNSRLDSLQAAVLKVKLRHMDRWNAMRRENAGLYTKLLGDSVRTPIISKDSSHVFHLYVVRHKERDRLSESLGSLGISTGIHYPTPVHRQKAYSHLSLPEGSFPVAEGFSKQILSLPMYPELSREQIEYVCESITRFT